MSVNDRPGPIFKIVGVAVNVTRDEVTLFIFRVSLPIFVMVMVVSLGIPTFTLSKDTVFVLNCIFGTPKPTPETITSPGDDGALLLIVSVAIRDPIATGA